MAGSFNFPTQYLSIGERIQSARKFLELGKTELAKARSTADGTREREACEKIFHALEEVLTARVQKYGVGAPTTHDDLRKWLETKRDSDLVSLFERAYLTLHVGAYYRGWTGRKEIDERVVEVEKAIDRVARSLKG